MRNLHLTFLLVIGFSGLFMRHEVRAQTTGIQSVSALSSTNCLGTSALFLVFLGPESLDVVPPSFVDDNPGDNITGSASYFPLGTFGSIIFLSIQVTNGDIGSAQTFTLTLEDAGGIVVLPTTFPPNGPNTDLVGGIAEYIFTINVDGIPTAEILPSDPLICNGNPANLTASVTNDASALSYTWSADGGNSNFQGGTPPVSASATVLAEDTYNVTISNACGSGSASTTVGADLTPLVDLSCQDNGNNTTTLSADLLNNANDVTISFFLDGAFYTDFGPLSGPNSVSEVINSLVYTNQDFTVTATNGCGNASNNSSCEVLLPVELQYFRAQPKDESVKLEWGTAGELNNDYFTIEKSFNGKDFSAIAKIEGAGTTQEPLSYSFMDEDALTTATATNTLYYRLRQTDFGGATTTYDLVPVSVPNSKLFSIHRLWQEEQKLIVNFAVPTHSEVEGRIFSLDGRLLQTQNQEVEAGNVQVSFSTSDLAPGMYLFSASNDGRIISEKFIKL
jgi:hypothetical protein